MAKRKTISDDDIEPVQQKWAKGPVLLTCVYVLASAFIVANAFVMQPTRHSTTQANTTQGNAVEQKPIIVADPLIEETQRELLSAGYYKGMVDGIMGDKTREAVIAYQTANELIVTGATSLQLVEHVKFQRTIAEAAEFTASTKSTVDTSDSAPDKQSTRISIVQSALEDLGYKPGKLRGEMTDATRDAIKKFEVDNKLAVTGAINRPMLIELRNATGYEDIAID